MGEVLIIMPLTTACGLHGELQVASSGAFLVVPLVLQSMPRSPIVTLAFSGALSLFLTLLLVCQTSSDRSRPSSSSSCMSHHGKLAFAGAVDTAPDSRPRVLGEELPWVKSVEVLTSDPQLRWCSGSNSLVIVCLSAALRHTPAGSAAGCCRALWLPGQKLEPKG